jgi:hypothetical protein
MHPVDPATHSRDKYAGCPILCSLIAKGGLFAPRANRFNPVSQFSIQFSEAMPDRKPKPDRPTPRKEKLCKTCGRPFAFQKKWAQDWDIIKHCSEACRNQKATASDAALEQAILTLLAERATDGDTSKTICPSEAAKLVAGDTRAKARQERRNWEALMEPARSAARRLVTSGKIVITQHNEIVDPATAKGPIRLRLR